MRCLCGPPVVKLPPPSTQPAPLKSAAPSRLPLFILFPFA